MNKQITRRITFAVAATVVTLGIAAGPAGAFEPPADPNDNFTCTGGPVMGHPGHMGLSTAVGMAESTTAWMAVSEDGPVTQC